MKVLTEGHKYELANFEKKDQPGQVLQFIEKCPVPVHPGDPHTGELITVNDGTTNEEVLAMIVDRLKVMNSKVPSRETSTAITYIEIGLMWLEKRTRERQARGVEGTMKA